MVSPADLPSKTLKATLEELATYLIKNDFKWSAMDKATKHFHRESTKKGEEGKVVWFKVVSAHIKEIEEALFFDTATKAELVRAVKSLPPIESKKAVGATKKTKQSYAASLNNEGIKSTFGGTLLVNVAKLYNLPETTGSIERGGNAGARKDGWEQRTFYVIDNKDETFTITAKKPKLVVAESEEDED